jgi:hypothetical protein
MHDIDEIDTIKGNVLSNNQNKGNCNDCDYYYNCPRMKGINKCYNSVKLNEKSCHDLLNEKSQMNDNDSLMNKKKA